MERRVQWHAGTISEPESLPEVANKRPSLEFAETGKERRSITQVFHLRRHCRTARACAPPAVGCGKEGDGSIRAPH